MTIMLYSGTPGSGKSLHMASDIRFRLKRWADRPILGNFDVNRDVLRHPDSYHYVPNAMLTPDLLTDFAAEWWDSHRFREDSLWLCLDEMQLLYNSRDWNQKGNNRQEWLTFFSQHRHYGYKVFFIAQGAKMVDNQFRMLIDYEVIHRKVSTAGTAGLILSMLCGGRLFTRVTTLYQTHDKLGAEFYVARRADMALYDTTATFDPTGGASALRARDGWRDERGGAAARAT